ncbi:unnamed protein product [Rhizophagus irregularis]|uniref:Uncharacterized protein n=2 Tax=Rhizophagus irregularis TaxID=588596 RepID=A0A2I1E536_9GLOM|nr:hypothetical protein RhiirB3_521830 [Rhizophagus irregularis]CAB4468621.1 unnamed protein product [Rhizophagus irregularis]CAB5177103.1 unnamed protein product [Rhizophagus irregularis]CAB5379947.1 unnamed protein product [Rhizophagus irregularis]
MDNLRREEEIIRDLKSKLYNCELELDGVKSLNESLTKKVTLMTNNEIEITHLKAENSRLRDECVKSYQEKEDCMSLNYTLSEQIKDLQEEVNALKMRRNTGFEELVKHPCTCDSCNTTITGIRYKCGHCADFDLCSLCIGTYHDYNHVFLKIRHPVHIDSRVVLLSPFRYYPGGSVHNSIYCDICGKSPIYGIRYKCGNCRDFDVCGKCEVNISKLHDESHIFIKLNRPVYPDVGFENTPLLPNFIPII